MPIIIRNYRKYRDWKMPIITLGLRHNEKWFPVDAYVDSGAMYSIFRRSVSERIGLEIEKGRLIYSQVGDGGFIPVFYMNWIFNWDPKYFGPPLVFLRSWESGSMYLEGLTFLTSLSFALMI